MKPGRTIVALLVAIALVVAASLVRSNVIDDDDDGGARDGPRLLLCATELEAACRVIASDDPAVRVTVEAAGTSLDRLSQAADDAAAGVDGWLTFSPFPEILAARRDARQLPPLFESVGDPLATSPLVFVVKGDRLPVLERECEPLDWPCLASLAGEAWSAIGGSDRWGNVQLAHANPTTSAVGLLAIGHAAAQILAESDTALADISSTDFDDPAFRAPFRQLERDGVLNGGFDPISGTPLREFIETTGASASVVATNLAEARSLRATPVVEIEPGASTDVVFAPTGHDDWFDTDAAVAALRDIGYEAGDGAGGIPRAGVLDALLDVWRQTV
jgi:hypothetical protein